MKKVLILGARGKIGQHSAIAFENAGWEVERFDRLKDDLKVKARRADVIVNGMNPPNYHDWAGIIPKITHDVIEAAKENDACVIIPGNVYHFGAAGGIWSEKTTPNPCTRKGQIRLDMEESYRESGVKTIVLRAGNFIDPNLQGCVMSMVYLRAIKRGKILLPGLAEARQAMCYLPDWARAAVELAELRSTLPKFSDIPFAGYTLSANDLKAAIERMTGQGLKFTSFPWWFFQLSAPFWELARELNEMRYLWDTDHALSSVTFDAILPHFQPTPLEDALGAVMSQAGGGRISGT